MGAPGGGSVDKVSPQNFLGHFLEDVLPAFLCCFGPLSNCDAYYQKRPSDNGEGYNPPNPGKYNLDKDLERTFSSLVHYIYIIIVVHIVRSIIIVR